MWEENMDPKLPLLDELITVRALLGEDPGEWGSVKLTLSPCLRLLFAGYAQDQADQGRRAPRLIDLISHLEHLSAATPSLEEFRDAPLLDEWSAGVGGDGCARLFGRVTGHPRLREGARIYTSPYLQVDPAAGWAPGLFSSDDLGCCCDWCSATTTLARRGFGLRMRGYFC